jgi:hypothetical protein
MTLVSGGISGGRVGGRVVGVQEGTVLEKGHHLSHGLLHPSYIFQQILYPSFLGQCSCGGLVRLVWQKSV